MELQLLRPPARAMKASTIRAVAVLIVFCVLWSGVARCAAAMCAGRWKGGAGSAGEEC